jgi:hypothetical protein
MENLHQCSYILVARLETCAILKNHATKKNHTACFQGGRGLLSMQHHNMFLATSNSKIPVHANIKIPPAI